MEMRLHDRNVELIANTMNLELLLAGKGIHLPAAC
jgi:hypothetical protein